MEQLGFTDTADKEELLELSNDIVGEIGGAAIAGPGQLRFTLDEVPVPTEIPQDSLF